jgi:hypothetical protein
MSAIKVGDLVMVVRGMPCCGRDTRALGMTYVVGKIYEYQNHYCSYCKAPLGTGLAAVASGSNVGVANHRLKRIPPLDELERDQIVKELTV